MDFVEHVEMFLLDRLIASPILQAVEEADHLLPAPAERIERLWVEMRHESEHIFDQKVLLCGEFLVRVSFVGTDHHFYEEQFTIPFSAEADAPGLRQGTAAKLTPRILSIQSDWELLDAKKVVVRVLARVEALFTIAELRPLPPVPAKPRPPRRHRVCRGAFEFKAVPCCSFSTTGKCC
ncbi:MAG: DUF3794 domain-containing protein [Firmicutes bacterium]|nr:DUF3794 domain-containing protein [Bacillota bacterium]